jgi:hypothetical protein
MVTSGGAVRLLRNDGADGARSVRVKLTGGAGSNVHGYGARVQVTAGGRTQTAWCRAGNSYASQSENVLTFGLGGAASADAVTVQWPSGKISRLTGVAACERVEVREADAAREADAG